MSTKKLYFREDDEYCYPLSEQKKFMLENGLSELLVYEVKKEHNASHFYCKKFQSSTEKGFETCGKLCNSYTPRNNVKGVCKYFSSVYEETKISKLLKIWD